MSTALVEGAPAPDTAGRSDAVGPDTALGPDTAGRPDAAGRPMVVVGPIVLVGMMATGKTTVGPRLAEALGRRMFDSDEMIEQRTGHTVAALWRAGGEAAFRRLETEVLLEALAARPPGVIAAAGGVVLSGANRAHLRQASEEGAVVVWLRADPAVLVSRVVIGDHRPLLDGDPAGTLRRLAAEREALYAEVADHTVEAGPRMVDEVVADILTEVGGGGRV